MRLAPFVGRPSVAAVSRPLAVPAPAGALVTALLSSPYFRARGAVSVAVTRTRRGTATIVRQVEVALGAHRERYWIKEYAGQPSHAEKEWRFLEREHARAGPGGPFRVARPVAYLADRSAVVTAHAEGEVLALRLAPSLGVLGALRGGTGRAAGDCRRTGAWLAWLHRADAGGERRHPIEALRADVEARLARAAARWSLRRALRDEVMARLDRLLAEIPPADLARVPTHGDFAPFNVLVSDDAVVALDPSFEESVDRLQSLCARYEDAARFCAYVEGVGAEGRAGARAAFTTAFLEGYNAHADRAIERASPGFRAFLLKHHVQAALDWYRRRSWRGRWRSPARLFERWCEETWWR